MTENAVKSVERLMGWRVTGIGWSDEAAKNVRAEEVFGFRALCAK